LVFIDDGVADDHDAIVAHAVDQIEHFRQTVVVAQRPQVLADERLEDIQMAIDSAPWS